MLVVIGVRVGTCADELCLMVTGMSLVVVVGLGDARRSMFRSVAVLLSLYMLYEVGLVVDCVVVLGSFDGW